jgi:hypothetical protein
MIALPVRLPSPLLLAWPPALPPERAADGPCVRAGDGEARAVQEERARLLGNREASVRRGSQPEALPPSCLALPANAAREVSVFRVTLSKQRLLSFLSAPVLLLVGAFLGASLGHAPAIAQAGTQARGAGVQETMPAPPRALASEAAQRAGASQGPTAVKILVDGKVVATLICARRHGSEETTDAPQPLVRLL